MTSPYKIDNGELKETPRQALKNEALIEQWIAEKRELIGLHAILIGKQVQTENNGRFYCRKQTYSPINNELLSKFQSSAILQ